MYHLFQQRLSLIADSNFEAALSSSKIGLEKESLRVSQDGGISQAPHPVAWGSPLTHPQITTDFSEALAELVTPPCDSIKEVIQSLDDIQNFVYRHLDNELLWATSMPCVVAGETSIPLAQYGSSNAAKMKTVYRRGLGLRYGRAMQVIAGVHFNYSFSDDFWRLYQGLLGDDTELKDFKSVHYMGLIRNLLRYGWLVPYLFGASPAVCKSFLNGKRTMLQEFNTSTYYEPYATSLRLGDIGYQNNKEDLAGIKANYNSLGAYVDSIHADGSRSTSVSRQINTLALLHDVVPPERRERVMSIVLGEQTENVVQFGSPFATLYLLEFLGETGRVEPMLDTIRELWGGMMDEQTTTFWESAGTEAGLEGSVPKAISSPSGDPSPSESKSRRLIIPSLSKSLLKFSLQ